MTPAANTGFSIADGLLALPAPPAIILTSSTDRTRFGSRLNGHRFIAKADICAAAIARLARTPGNRRTGIAETPALPRSAPSQEDGARPGLGAWRANGRIGAWMSAGKPDPGSVTTSESSPAPRSYTA